MNEAFLTKLKEYQTARDKYYKLDRQMAELTLKLKELTKERDDAKQKQSEKLKALAAMEI
jgi:phage-related tail protein